jgi:hypothetical protein
MQSDKSARYFLIFSLTLSAALLIVAAYTPSDIRMMNLILQGDSVQP